MSGTRNLVVACIEDHPKALVVLRTARKRAQEQGVRWRAVFVEVPTDSRQSEDGPRERMLRMLTLAKQMGAETAHVEAPTIEKGWAEFFAQNPSQVTLMVIGSIEPEQPFAKFRTLPWMNVVRVASKNTQVEVIPLSGQPYRRSIVERLRLRTMRPQYIAYALGAVGVAALCASALQHVLPPALFRVNDQNVALLFMIACAFSAGRYGLLPGLVASGASFFTMNYYFTVPYHVLKINFVTDALNMGLFLIAALLVSLFTSQARDYAQKVAQRETSTKALFTLYRIASEAFSREKALEKLQQKLEEMLKVDVAFFLPPIMHPEQIESLYPPGLLLSDADRKALEVAWTEMKTTGIGSSYNPRGAWRFEPMISPAGPMGVVGVKPRNKATLDVWFGRLFAAIADQTAAVLEHIDLERSMGETRISEEREKLRAMLLSSISHDFKTPLAGIIGALSVHRSLGEKLAPQKRTELIESAIEEAQRLDHFITNILDMTRLESGNIQFHQDWHSMDAAIKNVLKRLHHRCRNHQIVVHPCMPSVEVYMDAMMIEQVLQNILDNACKYTPATTHVEIVSTPHEEKGLVCQIRDYGPGMPADKIDRVFDKYARLLKKDSQVAGTGLGLAIAKAIMEAQGGWITAANHSDGGAVFTLCLPRWRRVKNASAQEEKPNVPFEQANSRH